MSDQFQNQPQMGQQVMPPPPGQTPPKTSGLAIASLVAAVLSFFCFGIIVGPIAIILGVKAMKKIKAEPQTYAGHGLALAGTIVGAVATFFYFIIVVLIAIPNFIQLRGRAYDAAAQSAGFSAKIAQELHFQESGGENGGSYTDQLSDLLKWDKNLTDDSSVTFIFGDCNSEGYTFTTRHANGVTDKIFTD